MTSNKYTIRNHHKPTVEFLNYFLKGDTMTMIRNMDIECGLCGETSSQPVLFSTNSMGYADLDLRPPAMQRDTMNTWVVECPHCRYVAENLEDKPKIGRDFTESEAYRTCEGNEFKSRMSSIFYRRYLICRSEKDPEGEFHNVLHCAWACDDCEDDLATDMRRLACELLEGILQTKIDENLNLLRADLLRRSGQFERVIEEYGNIAPEDKLLNDITRFQVEKAYLKDDACYTVKDVIDEFGGQ